jgi:hypothetical protein
MDPWPWSSFLLMRLILLDSIWRWGDTDAIVVIHEHLYNHHWRCCQLIGGLYVPMTPHCATLRCSFYSQVLDRNLFSVWAQVLKSGRPCFPRLLAGVDSRHNIFLLFYLKFLCAIRQLLFQEASLEITYLFSRIWSEILRIYAKSDHLFIHSRFFIEHR